MMEPMVPPKQSNQRPAKHGLRPGGSTKNMNISDKLDGDSSLVNKKAGTVFGHTLPNSDEIERKPGPKSNQQSTLDATSCKKDSDGWRGMTKSNIQYPQQQQPIQESRRNKSKKKNQQQRQPIQELKINSRASSLWASRELDKGDNFHCSSGSSSSKPVSACGSQARAKDVWAAVRAERLKKEEEPCLLKKEILVADTTTRIEPVAAKLDEQQRLSSAKDYGPLNNTTGHDSSMNATTGSIMHSSCSTYSSGQGHAFGQKNAIRKEWEKIDNGYAISSPMEEEMQSILDSLNEADVGMLSTLSAQLPMQLPDGEGGYITTIQEQNLADAAGRMMNRWNHIKKWTKGEARLAGQILLRMETEEVLGNGMQVGYRDYLSVINAYAKVTDEDETASVRAENILDHMEKRGTEGRPDLKPDRLSINTVMGAHAKHSLSGNLDMRNIPAAERLLETLEQEYARGDDSMQPTARTYSKIIDAYAKHGRADEAARALERMEIQYRNGNKAALPRTIHYTSVIDAFAKSGSSRAAGTAEEVLRSMLDLYDKGNPHLAPDSVVFSAVLDAYSKSKRCDAPEKSLGILELMTEYQCVPDIVTYNIILNTLALSNDRYYNSKARDILHFIEQSNNLKADSFTYNAVIKGSPPNASEELIQHWEMQWKMGKTDERPDSYTYVSLVKAWTMSNIKGYETKCVKILDWMEEQEVVGMNRIVYNEVMKAFSRSTRDDAGDLAKGIFNKLVARYEQSRDREMRPDFYSYIAVLNAYARSCNSYECAAKAEGVLFEMMDSSYVRQPDSKLCNNIISAWSRSGSNEAAARAEQLCDRMDSLGIEIDGVVFNSLINVYAKSCHFDRSVNALNVLHRMHERKVDPTSVTYSLLVDACLGDEECLLQVFEDCTRNGMLDERLQSSFMQHGPACAQEQLRGSIPCIWSQYANRGPGGKSRKQFKSQMKRGNIGADVRRFGWAR